MPPPEPQLSNAISVVNPSLPRLSCLSLFCCSLSTLFVEINMEIRLSKTAKTARLK